MGQFSKKMQYFLANIFCLHLWFHCAVNVTATITWNKHNNTICKKKHWHWIDVWDKLGTNLQNVTKDITKWNLDQHGTQKKFHGRNKHERAVVHEEHKETLQDIADLNDGELHSTDLSPENLEQFYKDNPLAIVDFFAPVSL